MLKFIIINQEKRMMKSSLIYNMLLLAKAMATDAKMISLELEQVPVMEYSSIYANRHLM